MSLLTDPNVTIRNKSTRHITQKTKSQIAGVNGPYSTVLFIILYLLSTNCAYWLAFVNLTDKLRNKRTIKKHA